MSSGSEPFLAFNGTAYDGQRVYIRPHSIMSWYDIKPGVIELHCTSGQRFFLKYTADEFRKKLY